MTTLTLSRPRISEGAAAEYKAFAELIASLTDAEWNAATRCEGWQVRDVAGHVIGLAEDVASGVPGSRTADEEAASVRFESPSAAAARLRAALAPISALLDVLDDATWSSPSPAPDLTFGEGVLTLWYDTFVHGDDIRAAAGRPARHGAGLDASVAHLADALTKKGYAPSTLTLDGVGRYDISGGGPAITGDAMQFVLVATGRAPATTIGLPSDVNIY
jgi:uncharacterized protein (TIGR03083 family)